MRAVWLIGAFAALTLAACEAPDEPSQGARACLEAEEVEARIAACTAAAEDDALPAALRSQALSVRGDAQFEGGDVTAALRDYASALELDGENLGALLGRAGILIDSGQLDAAAPLVQRAHNASPSSRSNELLGAIALRRGQYPEAIGFFDAALAQEPRLARAMSSRARAKLGSGDAEGAAADFNRAIERDGNLADARAGRCWLDLNADRQIERARADADAAVAADPNNVEGQLCRGVLQLRERQWAEAKASFDAVLAIDGGNTTALFGRGVARNRGGDRGGTRDMNQARDFESNISDRFADLGVNTY